MKPQTLLRLYPRRWRDRYGDEFVALLEQEGTGPRVVMSVIAGAFDAWVSPIPEREAAVANGNTLRPWLVRARTDDRPLRDRMPQFLGALLVGALIHALAWLAEAQFGHTGAVVALRRAAVPIGTVISFIPYAYADYSLRTKLAAAVFSAVTAYAATALLILVWP